MRTTTITCDMCEKAIPDGSTSYDLRAIDRHDSNVVYPMESRPALRSGELCSIECLRRWIDGELSPSQMADRGRWLPADPFRQWTAKDVRERIR